MKPVVTLDFSCRQDAAEPSWQDAFARAIAADEYFLCGHCAGRRLRLFPVHLPEEGGYCVRCAPRELECHRDDCWVHTSGRLFGPCSERLVRYLPSIFDLHTEIAPPVVTSGQESAARNYWYAGMTHLANATLMRATLEAFAAANGEFDYNSPFLTNPSAAEILDRFRLLLNEPLLVDGLSPRVAAKAGGLSLWVGLTTANLGNLFTTLVTQGGRLEVVFDEVWDAFGPTTRPLRFGISAEVARGAGGRTRAYDNFIPGPYLVFFSARETEVSRISVWPVALAGGSLMTAESGLEQEFLRWAAGRFALLKLITRASLSVLGPKLWPVHGVLPHRADAIVFAGGKVRLVEVAGSLRPEYLRTIHERLSAYRDRYQHPDVEAVAVARADVGTLNW